MGFTARSRGFPALHPAKDVADRETPPISPSCLVVNNYSPLVLACQWGNAHVINHIHWITGLF
jgi:hypothetical protein